MMSPIDSCVLAASFALAPAYICRLDRLRFGDHRSVVVLLHLTLFVGCLSAGYHAWTGAAGLTDAAAVAAAAAQIGSSWPTWRSGVPGHVVRPEALPDAVLARMVGGRSASDRSKR